MKKAWKYSLYESRKQRLQRHTQSDTADVGKYAMVGAASVVTHDVPDYAVVVRNPAKVIKILDKEKFE